jgi:periplasmic divalent cation tolerance protein
MDDVLFIYTTWPDAESAAIAGEAAVASGLAACVNLFPPIRSIYRWNGAVEQAIETPATFKTTARAAEALRAMILARHPYELPAILALAAVAEASHEPFLRWVAGETAQAPIAPQPNVMAESKGEPR